MSINKISKLAGTLLISVLFAGNAYADKPVKASCELGLTGSGAIDCTGAFDGNLGGALTTEQIGQINSAFGDHSFVYSNSMSYLKSDAAKSTLFADDGTDMSLNFKTAQKGLFVVGLKQADFYSFYLFNGGSTGIGSIAIDSHGIWTGGNGLSHAVYIGNITNAVPEPGTYAMLLGGLGMMGWMVRRRKQA